MTPRDALRCPACHCPDHDPGSCPNCPRCELHVDEALIWVSRVSREDYDEFVEAIEAAARAHTGSEREAGLDVERLAMVLSGRMFDYDGHRVYVALWQPDLGPSAILTAEMGYWFRAAAAIVAEYRAAVLAETKP